MRLWLNRTGDVSLREQLITQVVLGILSRELAPGQRLPKMAIGTQPAATGAGPTQPRKRARSTESTSDV